ncbi:MAG: biotin carboxylase N-terminal domain-containing protein [Chloroflexota bacterium]
MARRRILAIANRGEIAVRIARTARALGWEPVALLGAPDLESYAAREIGNVVELPAGGEFEPPAVVQAAQGAGATALHPGYGFLSERPGLARTCEEAGITFVGPSAETLDLCGDKVRSRDVAIEAGVPVVAGSPLLDLEEPQQWSEVAGDIGYPVIVKVAGAGGGRGLRVAFDSGELANAVRSAASEAGSSGAGRELFLEHYLERARHVEVQVAGDGTRAVALGDRDCSLQRRHQKVIEEAPAPGLSAEVRSAIHESAAQMAEAVGLRNLATVEFLVGGDGNFFFMEINPRLQVEHTVTEEVTGFDLVAMQLDLAVGGSLPDPLSARGHAMQARLYAEDPFAEFLPDAGRLKRLEFPRSMASGSRLRIDQGYQSGDTVPGAYDPMLAKIIVWAGDREATIHRLHDALAQMRVAGLATNRPWLIALLQDPRFRDNRHNLHTAGDVVSEWSPPGESAIRQLAKIIAGDRVAATAWDITGAFRIVAPATFTVHGDDPGEWQETVTLPAGWNDEATGIAVESHGNGAYELTTPSGRWVLGIGPRVRDHAASQISDGTLVAPMPGTVLAINAEQGDAVSEGQQVATIEAMKMEISLDAPFDGVVAAIHISAGDLIGAKQPVITITQHEEAS